MASELTLEQKTWHQLECAANSAGGIEVAMVSLPIAQVKALVEGRNTRPAPAATDTGLVTVAFQHRRIDKYGVVGDWRPYKRDLFGSDRIESRELVTRSQAEELLAAKDARIKELEAALDSDPSGSGLWRYWSRKACETSQKYVDEVDRAEALEAKLAAAEKALEPFAAHANDRAVDDTGWRDKETVKIVVSIGDLRKARAVLGGKP